MLNILKKKIITSQLIVTILLTFLPIFIIDTSLCAPEEVQQFTKIPILTNKNFDNILVKLQIAYEESGLQPEDIGTGFVALDGTNVAYVVSAAHVFKAALEKLLRHKGIVRVFQRAVIGNEEKGVIFNDIPLIDYWKKGLLVFNDDYNIDVGILRLREFTKESELVKEKPITEERVGKKTERKSIHFDGVDLLNDNLLAKFDEIDKAEEVIFFGYPIILNAEQIDKSHIFDPIIRRGTISKFVDGKKTIIEGSVSSGSSGSPVFLRSTYISPTGLNIKLQLIGIVTQYLPTVVPKVVQSQSNVENAGLALIESVDNVLDTLKNFETTK